MNFKSFATALGVVGCFAAQSASAGWIDWSNTTTGVMDAGGNAVNVTLTGSPWNMVDGDGYYNNSYTGYTAPDGTYAGMAPSDLIRVDGPSSFTLTFSESVSDLYMALVSVGQSGVGVDYDFEDAFSVISSGPNEWGYTGYTIDSNEFTGNEFNGILHFEGAFTSITFETDPKEFWHGFNFASYVTTASVPEPASLGLLGLGLLGVSAFRRRNAA